MNVFVLSTGRCGSATFAKACRHFTNYTVAHESQNPALHLGVEQPYGSLRYPPNHIEVDKGLSWFLGSLEKQYGKTAFYVHLLRRREEVARSLAERDEDPALSSFACGILHGARDVHALSADERYQVALRYWDTVNDNIEMFLHDKPRKATMWLHDIRGAFAAFSQAIEADVRIDAALAEWDVRHDASKPDRPADGAAGPRSWADRLRATTKDIVGLVPEGQSFLLVDDGKCGAAPVVAGRRCLPFLEKDGQYWGPPPDDVTAIRELERLRQSGTRFIVFGWPSFWWLDQYPDMHRYLRSTYTCAADNERVVAFDLRK
jgi:hypothetical protein